MRIRKSRYIKSDRTCCYIRKFNIAFNIYRALGVTFYFSKSSLEAAIRISAVTEVPQPLGVTMICFLRQESNLQSFALQQRHRLFSRYFLHLSLINLLLLASLEERSIYRELDCFLEVENKDNLERNDLADKATRNRFALFWEAIALSEVDALSCFQE